MKRIVKTITIDVDKCTGCGECFNGCIVDLPNEFDMGRGIRKAIYVPFPQATTAFIFFNLILHILLY